MKTEQFTGGPLETNCFLLQAAAGNILIDAPQDAASWLATNGYSVDLMLLTHGHFDHVGDAAAIVRQYNCQVGYHADSEQMLTDTEFFSKLGIPVEVEPVKADFLIEEVDSVDYLGENFQVLLVPGHCPGSLCFVHPASNRLFGGDVLFAGGVGRWDLPGGDYDLLMTGIRNKLMPLDDQITVLPGHGPATTIGRERQTNPYLQ